MGLYKSNMNAASAVCPDMAAVDQCFGIKYIKISDELLWCCVGVKGTISVYSMRGYYDKDNNFIATGFNKGVIMSVLGWTSLYTRLDRRFPGWRYLRGNIVMAV